jgi:Protein of unknown function (DUF3102)
MQTISRRDQAVSEPDTITGLDATAATAVARINEHHRQAIAHAREALHHAKRCGDLLLIEKAKLGHGEWLPWLAANVEISERQVQRYMHVAENWAAIEESAASQNRPVSDLSMRGALELLQPPTLAEQLDEPAADPLAGLLAGDHEAIVGEYSGPSLRCIARVLRSRRYPGYSWVEVVSWSESDDGGGMLEHTKKPIAEHAAREQLAYFLQAAHLGPESLDWNQTDWREPLFAPGERWDWRTRSATDDVADTDPAP